jgi:cytochrome P450
MINIIVLHALLGLTEDEITGNAMLFLLAGYDTTASTMTFMAYCLGTNPESQKKLIEEIDSILGKVRISFYLLILLTDILCHNRYVTIKMPPCLDLGFVARYFK